MLPGHKILSTLNSTVHRRRWISSTSYLNKSWIDKIKGVISGPKPSSPAASSSTPAASTDSFTLLRFAEELGKARKLGTFKQYIVGRSSEATFADAFQKQEAILRYLGDFDPSGEKIQSTQKQEAAKKCNSTIAEVENTLAKFTWAKEAQKKIEKLKEEGKPGPEVNGEYTNGCSPRKFGQDWSNKQECFLPLWIQKTIQKVLWKGLMVLPRN